LIVWGWGGDIISNSIGLIIRASDRVRALAGPGESSAGGCCGYARAAERCLPRRCVARGGASDKHALLSIIIIIYISTIKHPRISVAPDRSLMMMTAIIAAHPHCQPTRARTHTFKRTRAHEMREREADR